jgi:hypothetical protein
MWSSLCNENWHWKPRQWKRTSSTATFCPPQIPHNMITEGTHQSYGMASSAFVWTTQTHVTQLEPEYDGNMYIRNDGICANIQAVRRPKSKINIRRQCFQGRRATGQAQTNYVQHSSWNLAYSTPPRPYTHSREERIMTLCLCVIGGM